MKRRTLHGAKRALALQLSALFACGTLETWVKAVHSDESYWDPVKQESKIQTCTVAESDTINWMNGKWYAVTEDVTISDRIEVSGTVNLILCDGETLTPPLGIHLKEGNTPIIWHETVDGSSTLIAGDSSNPVNPSACIGGGHGGNPDGPEKSEQLLSASTSGKNEAERGFMGKICSFFEPSSSVPMFSVGLSGGYPQMYYNYVWSIEDYRDLLRQYREENQKWSKRSMGQTEIIRGGLFGRRYEGSHPGHTAEMTIAKRLS